MLFYFYVLLFLSFILSFRALQGILQSFLQFAKNFKKVLKAINVFKIW